ncbi:MAG: hypothetical protein C0631_09460 [Sedimenticola sp.]|nr:MAG: hypothetical protein C0631_09460 [Sedimenticola sp.]
MRRLLLLLILIVGLVVAYQWYGDQWLSPVDEETAQLQKGGGIQLPKLNAQELIIDDLPDIGYYQSVIDRPMFTKSRTPFVLEDAPEVQQVVVTNLRITLKGIILTPDGHVALIEDKAGKVERLQKDDSYQGWTVDQITPEKVILIRDTEKEEIPLRVYSKVLTAPNAAQQTVSRRKEARPNLKEILSNKQKAER